MKIKNTLKNGRTPFKQFQLELIANLVFAFLHQMDIRIKKNLINFDKSKRPAIYAIWHGYQWGIGLFDPDDRKNINVLVSVSNDGEIIAKICKLLGFSLVRGSHKRKGEQATREMLSVLGKGESVAFMVDGPRGPKQKVKKGIIRIAKMAQVPIIPIVPYMKNKKCFNSWDNYQVPWTFYIKGTLAFGEPIYIPADADEETEEKYRLQLEQILFDVEKIAIKEHENIYGRKKDG